MRRFWLVLTLLVAAAARTAATQEPSPAESNAPAVRIEYVTDSLPNGLRVLYHVDHSTPVAAVDIWYDVGSKHEVLGRTGFAHLFEHMMFKGSRNVPDGQHYALLEAAGGRAGPDINGTTSTDRTNYFEQVPSNQLELALWIEADRMGTLLETVDQKKLDNQRDVVKNERRQRIDNQPYGTWFLNVLAAAFPAEHPYHHPVIGSMADLSAATLDDVKQFFRTYYAPNNAVLVIAGDIDVDQARRLVRKHFAAIPRGPAVPPLRSMAVPPVLGAAQRRVVPDSNAPSPAVYVAFRVPSARDSNWAAVPLLASVLADGKASRLYNTLVRERQLATNVFGFNFGMVDGADVIVFNATGRPGVDPAELERTLLAVLDSARAGVSQSELDRARAGTRFRFVDGLQRTGAFGGRADLLAQGATLFHDPNWVNTVLPHYAAVTTAQLGALASERLVPENRATFVYVPAKKDGKAAGLVP
jgi:predicted Zn-dependent peptidase